MKKTLPEIFEDVKNASTKEEKLRTIQMYYSVSVGAVLSMLFNPKIVFNLPNGIPEDFKFNNEPTMSLERAIKSFPAFVSGKEGPRLETAWFRLMRSIDEKEARFAFALKDKDYDIGLTQADVHEVFPQLIPAPEKDPFREPAKPAKVEEKDPVDDVDDEKVEEKKPAPKKPAPAKKK